jgi:hypothetical protein
MVVNFRARGINQGARKLARTPTLNLKKKKLIILALKYSLKSRKDIVFGIAVAVVVVV